MGPFTSLRVGPTSLWGGAFVLYACASLLWSVGDPIWSLAILASLVASYILGTYLPRPHLLWLAFLCILTLNFGTIPWGLPWGIWGGQNYLGAALAIGLAGAIVYEHFLFVPIMAIGVLWTHSRGAILAVGGIFLISLWRWSKSVAIGLVLLSCVVAISVSIDRGNSISFWARMGIWQDTIEHLTLFGSGWGSFADAYASWPVHRNSMGTYPLTQEYPVLASHPYNDFLEMIFELGIGAVVLWIFLACTLSTDSSAKLIVWTFFILALTHFPLHILPLGQLLALTFGSMSQRRTKCQPVGALEASTI